MTKPTVSIIIPNYNYARYLPERLDSIFNQTFQDYEVIILDDCSTDSSHHILDKYCNHPKVTAIIYNDANSGSPFKQWAKGIGIAKGKYIWIAEADDSANPQLLERAVKALDSDSRITVSMVLSRTIDSDGNDTGACKYDDCVPDGNIDIYSGTQFVNHKMVSSNRCYNASMAVFRHNAWTRLESYDFLNMRFCGDWLFWIQIISMGNVAVVHEELSYFRFHGNSVTDKSAHSPRLICETWQIIYYIFTHVNNLSRTYVLENTYNILKKYKHGNTDFKQYIRQTMSREFQEFLTGNIDKYPIYWCYKHFLKPIVKLFPGKKLKPVAILRNEH